MTHRAVPIGDSWASSSSSSSSYYYYYYYYAAFNAPCVGQIAGADDDRKRLVVTCAYSWQSWPESSLLWRAACSLYQVSIQNADELMQWRNKGSRRPGQKEWSALSGEGSICKGRLQCAHSYWRRIETKRTMLKGTKVRRYNWHSAGFEGWPFPTLDINIFFK